MDKNSKKNLYIFTTSDVPDVYLNTIGYCIEHFSQVEKIILLSIVRDKGLQAKTKEQLNRIKLNIAKQLSLLQGGKYMYKDQDTRQWLEKDIDIEEYDRRRYALFAMQDIDTSVIFYDELDTEISTFLNESGGNCIFDVSAVLKAYLIDVFMLLVEKGATNIHVFELSTRKQRTYDEQELIHNLALDMGDYEYVNLAERPTHLGRLCSAALKLKIKINLKKNL